MTTNSFCPLLLIGHWDLAEYFWEATDNQP
jgi:hypothetical protein